MIVMYQHPRRTVAEKSAILREVLLSRDGPHCVYCGVNLLADVRTFAGMTLDHFRPKRLGGHDNSSNRVLSCFACDKLKSGREFKTLDDAREWIAGRYAELERARAAMA